MLFLSLIHALTWSNGFCVEIGKRGGLVGKGKGPWQNNVVLIKKQFNPHIQFLSLVRLTFQHVHNNLTQILSNKSTIYVLMSYHSK